MAALCLNFSSSAQNTTRTIHPLNIGDKVSEEVWNLPLQVINNSEGKKNIRLSDYRHKLIILDFWATWCSSCLTSFPKLDSINVSRTAQIILVNAKKTGDDEAKINKVLSRLEIERNREFSLPVVFDDNALAEVFPHNILPHYVWLYNGVVQAITDSYEVGNENIKAFLKDKRHTLQEKSDKINFNYNKPFRENFGVAIDSSIVTTSLFMRYTRGLVSGKNVVEDSKNKRYYFTNRPIISLYQFAFDCSYNRIVIDLKNGRKLPSSPKELGIQDNEINNYRKNNLFCYELIVPKDQSDQDVRSKILADLNQFFRFNGRMEKQKVRCFVLSRVKSKNHGHSSQSKSSEDRILVEKSANTRISSIKELVHLLNYHASFDKGLPIVIDETNYTTKVDMVIPNSGIGDIESLSQALSHFGFTLATKDRLIDMFIITD